MPTQAEVNEYLDRLYDNETTNILGTGLYITAEFGVSKQQAHYFLVKWMQTFEERHSKLRR